MFLYFPASYKWSLSVALLIESIAAGAATMGEIHEAGGLLTGAAASDDVDAWYAAWFALARRVESLADGAETLGDAIGARDASLRAASYFQIADRLLDPSDPRKIAAYRDALRCFERARRALAPRVERVEVAYEGTALPAYFVHPEVAPDGPLPVVVFFDGLDVNKEQLYAFAGRHLAKYGLAALIVDGPGNGEALRLRGLTLRYDYEVAARACVDYLIARDDVDPAAIGLLAVSLGGYYATRSAAFEPRFAATAAWGGVWDYHRVWEGRRRLAADSPVSVDHAHLRWMLGVATFDDALEMLRPFVLEGVAQRITAPFLIVHGAADKQIPVADARTLYDAVASTDKSLVVLEDENFGAQHAQIDNMTIAHHHLFPWLRARLTRTAVAARR